MLSGSLVLRRVMLDLRGHGEVGIDTGKEVLRRMEERDLVGLKVLVVGEGASGEGDCGGRDVLILVNGRTGLVAGGDWRRMTSGGMST